MILPLQPGGIGLGRCLGVKLTLNFAALMLHQHGGILAALDITLSQWFGIIFTSPLAAGGALVAFNVALVFVVSGICMARAGILSSGGNHGWHSSSTGCGRKLKLPAFFSWLLTMLTASACSVFMNAHGRAALK